MNSLSEILASFLKFELYSSQFITIRISTLIFALLTFIVTSFILKFLKRLILKVFPTEKVGRLDSVFNFFSYFTYTAVFFAFLNAIGININMFLTASAALFVGLGFALQQIFQDLIAGIYILLDRTLDVGDIIEIDNKVAKVQTINLRSTIAMTRDRKILVIPNRNFVNDIIHNWTQDQVVIRDKIDVGVYIGTDVQLARDILLRCAESHDLVLKDPAPLVMLDRFGESSIRFYLYYFINDSFINDRIASDIRFEIDKQFKLNNIKLPVPVLRLEKE